MARAVGFVRTLVYWDGIQAAIARDEVGQLYLSVLMRRTPEGDTYLSVPITLDRLRLLESGALELRSALQNPEVREWFTLDVSEQQPRQLLQPTAVPAEEWLPDPGFFLNELAEGGDRLEGIVEESTAKGKAVLHLRLTPPEATTRPQISAGHLSQALWTFQELLKQAYLQVLRTLAQESAEGIADTYLVEVFAFSAGSFTVHMHSRLDADMFGKVELVRALEKVDELTENVEDTEYALEAAKRNRGHLVGAYKRFLRFLAESGSAVQYDWSSPDRGDVRHRKISAPQARILYEKLQLQRELAEESTTLRGVFVRANVESGAWAVCDDDGHHRRGRIASGAEVSLSGVVLGTQRYELECVERVEETGSGDLISALELTALHQL